MKKRLPLLALAWFVLALIFSYKRSLWGDEWIRVDQSNFPLVAAFKSLWSEPSPFSPGETFLNWIFRICFSWLPLEIWSRLPGILFGTGYVWLSFVLSQASGARFLPALAFFSVPLLMLSAEMRSYGSLFFAGQAALVLLWFDKGKAPKSVQRLALIAAVFSHVYGVCFVAWAALRRKNWAALAASVAVLAVTATGYLLLGAKSHTYSHSSYSFVDIARQTLGGLSNPHKSSLLFLGFGMVGVVELWKKQRKMALELIVFGFFAIACPILATVASGYFFVPRQVAGGAALVAFLAAFGLNSIESSLSKPLRWTVLLPLLPMAVVPFFLSIAMTRPPFPDQPRNDYRELARDALKDEAAKEIFVVNPCERLSFEHYFSRILGRPPEEKFLQAVGAGGFARWQLCWPRVCVSGFVDQRFCSASGREVSGRIPSGMHRVFYSSDTAPMDLEPSVQAIRTW